MTTPDLDAAHEHSSKNRAELSASEVCGCFSCLATFPPDEIEDWTDEDCQTALCPKCGADAVLGSASGLPLDAAFLRAMKARWF